MQELLKALQEGDTDKIDRLARELLLTRSGHTNKCQVNEFERYAPCQVIIIRQGGCGDVIGGIKYNDKTFMFG